MKTKTNYCIAVVCLILFCAWTTHQTNAIKNTEWLIGTWENKTTKGSMYENWSKTSVNELSGKSYILRDKDTLIFENIRLVQEQDVLFYIPTVKNQNDALPVRFIAQKISATQLIFENPAHDFPKIISYTKVGTDSLVAEISGMQNGKDRKQTFAMKRVK